jgi:hypothetical protein
MFKYFFFLLICFSIFGCKQNNTPAAPAEKVYPEPKRQAPATITYLIADAKAWLLSHQADSNHLSIVLAANRTDSLNFSKMDSVIVPTDLTGDIAFYLPFPLKVPYLRDVQKIVFFSYPTQTFATYEHGHLIYTGATNMGRQKDTTPTGLFFTNWKAEETISTFNDEWELRWNFNISNLEGIGWHQYSLPGYPASHSCLRLQEKDAKYLFDWADQWELNDQDSILVKGTPVIVYGKYDFDSTKAWLQLVADPKALDISEAEIEKETSLYLTEILNEQKKRETFQIEKKQ